MPIRAVLFDFGGVITSSPFEAFNRYEGTHDLPADFIRTVNSTNADDNAWARFERSAITAEEFDRDFLAESTALGHGVAGSAVLELLAGELRPEMVEVVRRCGEEFAVALLTNNVVSMAVSAEMAPVLDLFDVIVESSVVGVRKPEPRFYEIACERLGIDPAEAVFLDDLGINLKPARAMGMTTIKVGAPALAIADLESALGRSLR